MVLPPGAAAWQYAHYNVQETYVAPGGWQPSQAALAEAEARAEWQHHQEQVGTAWPLVKQYIGFRNAL